jgi:serine/threonine-protein kinase
MQPRLAEVTMNTTPSAKDPSVPRARKSGLRLLAGKYQLLAPLSRRGAGNVFVARCASSRRPVAVGILPHGANPKHARELEMFRGVRHPNVSALIDCVTAQDGSLALVTDLAAGQDIKTLLGSQGPLSEVFALEVTLRACEGLHAAHARGVVHKQLSTSSVLVDATGPHLAVKVVGFGMGMGTGATVDPSVTSSPQLVDVYAHRAPEQLMAKAATPRSDVYSLGVVLFEMLTARLPFRSRTPADVLRANLLEPPLAMGEANTSVRISGWAESIVRRCLAKSSEDRWPSMTELAAEIRACLDAHHQRGTPSWRPEPVAVLRRPVRGKTARIAADPGEAATLLDVSVAPSTVLEDPKAYPDTVIDQPSQYPRTLIAPAHSSSKVEDPSAIPWLAAVGAASVGGIAGLLIVWSLVALAGP